MKMIYKILIATGILAALGGLGWWGYKQFSRTADINNVGTENCSGAAASGQTCAPPGVGGVNTWHWTTCAPGYHGVDGVGCLENTGGTTIDRCEDQPGTSWSCVGEGGDKSCTCCPNGTSLIPNAIFYTQGHDFANDCGAGNVRLGSEFLYLSEEDAEGNQYNVYKHTCQGYGCGGTTTQVAPTFSCNGLVREPTTTPTIGQKVTFTCQASVVPQGAINLDISFRYSINNGAWTNLPKLSGFPRKAELTPATCGTYKVECRACGTIDGVKTCDPEWSQAVVE